MKRYFCLLLILIILLTACPLAAKADAVSNEIPAGSAAGNSEKNYFSYLSAMPDYPIAAEEIIINAADFTEDNNSGVNLEENYADADGTAVIWESHKGSLTWNFTVPADGKYQMGFVYCNIPDHGNPIGVDVRIDGTYFFPEMQNIELPRMYRDASEVRKDGSGNEFAPQQEEISGWYQQWAKDSEGLTTAPYVFALKAGNHSLTVSSGEEAFALLLVKFAPAQSNVSYKELSKTYDKLPEYSGDVVVIEGEDAKLKTGASLIAKSDTTDPSVYPSEVFRTRINYIGSTNWQQPGQTLSWNFEAPEDGLYQLAFRFRQSYLLNCDSYRNLTIDGDYLFEEASEIAFAYGSGWQFLSFSDESGSPYLLYLTKGTHTLSLEVTVGPMANINRRMQGVVSDLGTIYRKFVMIVGNSPDSNRDYNLFGQIPDLEKQLTATKEALEETAAEIEKMTGQRSGTNAVTLRNMSTTIGMMLDNRYRVQNYQNEFYSNYCAVSSWLNEMKNMPLDIDEIFLASPKHSFDNTTAGFFEKLKFSAARFVSSFISDYNNISGDAKGDKKITLWLNWGRDQVQVLNSLIQRTFTPESGISVNVQIVNASLIQAILSGNGPDCSLMLSRTQPVNLAMRGALYDLKNFEDFESITEWFMPTAFVPYEYQGGCYAVPDTQQFSMMFYRTDILEELNIELPQTWDDLIKASDLLMRYNMQIGLPYTQITDIGQTDAGMGALNLFPTLLQQFDANLYTEDLSATALTEQRSVEAFNFWTDLYTKYKFPLSYDLYNRFRTGEIPIAISGYTLYATLKVAAPEINGRWAMALIPGMADENGNVRHIEAAGGTGAVILNISKHKKEAWEFLKWWVSADTQYSYSAEVESILGVAGRHSTANVEALSRMSWDTEDLEILLSQWKQVEEIPEIAGGYYVPRVIDQAFWNTINNNEVPQDMLIKWSQYADIEISRKRREYNVK